MENDNQSNLYRKRPLWQWLIFYVVIGAIIYAGVYYFLIANKGGASGINLYQTSSVSQSDTATPTSSQNQSGQAQPQVQNTVTLTSNGFSPSTITIKVGQTVTWINQSGQVATVNSDPHPVHTDYPPLNLGKFNDGETRSLTFDTPGTHGYHNHLNSSQKGTVIVQ